MSTGDFIALVSLGLTIVWFAFEIYKWRNGNSR